jgi:Zn-dependent protease
LGDDTAWRLGRVTFNPLKHIDPVGTILLPGLLLFLHSPFLFGYAKPVPINFRALHNPRRDMVLVAAAGPGMNILLALIAAIGFYLVGYLPDTAAQWLAENLKNALIINYGMMILIGVLFIMPMIGAQLGIDLNVVSQSISAATGAIIGIILWITGHTYNESIRRLATGSAHLYSAESRASLESFEADMSSGPREGSQRADRRKSTIAERDIEWAQRR